jgi:RimJ/RimL family protein N-acetyltransferase
MTDSEKCQHFAKIRADYEEWRLEHPLSGMTFHDRDFIHVSNILIDPRMLIEEDDYNKFISKPRSFEEFKKWLNEKFELQIGAIGVEADGNYEELIHSTIYSEDHNLLGFGCDTGKTIEIVGQDMDLKNDFDYGT